MVQTALPSVSQLPLDKAVNAPVVQVVQFVQVVRFLVAAQRLSHGPDCSSGHPDSQLLLDTVIDVPVVQVVRVPQVLLLRRRSRSHGCTC